MAVAPKLPDFNPHTAPIGAKLAVALNKALWLLVATPLAQFVVPLIAGIFVAIAVSKPIRIGRDFGFELLFVTLFFVIREAIGWPFLKIVKSQWFLSLYSGKPQFGPLKGPGKSLFRFILRCFASVELRLEPEIETVFRKSGDSSFRQVEELYRRTYERAGYEPSDWPDVWEKIQHAEFAGVEYCDAIRTGRWDSFYLKYYSVQKLVLPFSALYTAGTFWFLDRAAQGKSPLHLVQFTLVAGFIIAFVIFTNYTLSLRVGKMLTREQAAQIRDELLRSADAETRAAARELDNSMQDPELEHELETYAGRDFYPVISMKPGYIKAIRNEFVRNFLIIATVSVLALEFLVLIQWPIAHVLSHWTGSQVDAWTGKMMLGTALIPIALTAAISLGFMILSRLKKLASVLTTALLLAVVPPLITYALHRSVSNVVLISSVVTAAVGVLPSAIAELVKQKPNLEGAP
jgi:hypothetical protein